MKHIAVTGAGGFIGSRLVEVLAGVERTSVRALLRRGSNAARVARHGNVTLLFGDVTSSQFVREALVGCDTVYHCAFGNRGSDAEQRAATVDGTANVMAAAAAAHVRRVVHLSSVAAWGYDVEGVIDERASYPDGLSGYCLFKKQAEEEVARLSSFSGAPSVAVLLPTIVYGPYSPFVLDTVQRMATGRFGLPPNPGMANHIYVDDLVHAMLRASVADFSGVEKFIITDPQPEAFDVFFGRFAEMLGQTTVQVGRQAPLASRVTRPGILRASRSIARDPEVRRLLASVPGARTIYHAVKKRGSGDRQLPAPPGPSVAAPPVPVLSAGEWTCYSAPATFNGAKAAAKLGFAPVIGLVEGMNRTEWWLQEIGAVSGDARRPAAMRIGQG